MTDGFEGNNFKLYFQPISPILTGEHPEIHCEVLLRLQDSDGKVITPAEFLPVAHRYKLMQSIDRWVVSNFFKFYERISRREGKFLFNINLSGATLNDPDFLDFVKEQFEKYRVPPRVICFEITENAAISNFPQVRELIVNMKKLGCHFALDDFGSGLSSFNYLKYLPVDFLKIDGSFVRDMIKSKIDCAIVKSANEIGHLMNLRTIAEYVENELIYLKLREFGIDYAQGYWFSKPRPLEEIVNLYTESGRTRYPAFGRKRTGPD
jgi:EAL domain-containing protein (putative c-di-GMP-specific phosphodiesterase class I)